MLFVSDENELKFDNDITIVYFYTSYFQFHSKLMVVLGKCEEIYPNVDIFAIDIEYFQNIEVRFKLKNIPTIIIIKNGKEIKRVTSILSTDDFMNVIGDI